MRAQTCLLCNRQAGSREHLWAAWIHQRLPRREPIRITFAIRPMAISKNPEIKVKTVCGVCNNGWMSDLEAACIPIIGNLMKDISIPSDASQQSFLSTWARNPFYEKTECEQLRMSSTIPDRTRSMDRAVCSQWPSWGGHRCWDRGTGRN